MYKTEYFTIHELVNPQIIKDIGETNCWMRLDKGYLMDIDIIRIEWGKLHSDNPYIVINGMYNGSQFKHSGARHWNQEYLKKGSAFSLHKLFKAGDLKPKNNKHEEFWYFVYDLIESGKIKNINAMEDRKFTPTWCHVAVMNTSDKPLIIKP